jgi:hypothetical protein
MYCAPAGKGSAHLEKFKLILLAIHLLFLSAPSLPLLPTSAQNTKLPPPTTLLKRTATRHETTRFNYGGTITIVGAPKGSIKIEGWQRNEVDLTADIEWQAESEADLNLLAPLNNFAFDEDSDHLRIITSGTHDRAFMKRAAKNFPKRLLNMPWKIDYRLRVPASADVEIDAGHGPIGLSSVEGALRINATESETALVLTGGSVSVTIAAGNVNLSVPVRSWRGPGAEVRIAAGVLNVEVPLGFNGDIDADVLRAGKIVNTYEGLGARDKPGITERSLRGRAGSGGAYFRFVVGDGVIAIKKTGEQPASPLD